MKKKAIEISLLLGLALLWGALVFVVGFSGDFPLNDDWVYAWSVEQFIDGRGLQLLPYTGPLVYFQVLLGAAIVKIFGFSFIVLRLITLVFGLVALWSLYWLLRQRHVNPIDSFLITLVLALNPWMFNLSFTFMTDVPFLALFLLACALFVRSYKKRSVGVMILACVLVSPKLAWMSY